MPTDKTAPSSYNIKPPLPSPAKLSILLHRYKMQQNNPVDHKLSFVCLKASAAFNNLSF